MGEYDELALPPKSWHTNLSKEEQVSYSQTKRRMRTLRKAGLIETDQDRNDYYTISEMGISYVNGSISREKLESMEPD